MERCCGKCDRGKDHPYHLVESGDAGSWDWRTDEEVIQAQRALKGGK